MTESILFEKVYNENKPEYITGGTEQLARYINWLTNKIKGEKNEN